LHSNQCNSGVGTVYPIFPSSEFEALLALVLAPSLSNKKIRLLITQYGSAIDAFLACTKALVGELSQETKKYFDSDLAYRLTSSEIALAQRLKTDILPFYSPLFPDQLKTLSDCPLILYCKGTLPQKNQPCVAIIGTRNASEWGKESASFFAKSLASIGCCIVSGLARGIDTAAHKGSLLTGTTLAIIGSGIGHIYPRENISLAEEITSKGAVISELPLQTPPTRFSFPKRNRLISAFADTLLVAEAPLKSGSMLTMSMGYEQKKQLFALPGRALNELCEGNHHLIQSGKASLAHHPDQIAHALGLSRCTKPEEKRILTALLPEEQKILDLLSPSELSLEKLSSMTTFPISHLQLVLMQLMLKGLIKELPGKRYIVVI
jgi:DNA processing protein